MHLSTSVGLIVDECKIKRLTYHKNDFLPDKYMSHGNREMFEGKCVKYNSLPSKPPRSNQLMKRMKREIFMIHVFPYKSLDS